jgi:hypothetical protein
MISPEEFALAMPESLPPSPFRAENYAMLSSIDGLYAAIENIWRKWLEEYLNKAKLNDKDPDDYAKPLITLAEILRIRGLQGLGARVYERAIEFINDYEEKTKLRLHRGAIYANFAISHIEAARYDLGVSWLHAAAQEDISNLGIQNALDSNALSDDGIFVQFLNAFVLRRLPTDLIPFLDTNLNHIHTDIETRALYRWLAGEGDIHLISSILEYDAVKGRSDPHSDSVRLVCLRDLATLFEVVWKRVGANHNDPVVRAEFVHPPTLAGLICHMHFKSDRKARRQNPALNVNWAAGVLWNDVCHSPILDAVDSNIDYCAGDAHSVQDAWNHLNAATEFSSDPVADMVARRFLLAYKLRNFTSHTFQPQDVGVKAHHEAMHLWLLQGIFFLYFWSKATGQI